MCLLLLLIDRRRLLLKHPRLRLAKTATDDLTTGLNHLRLRLHLAGVNNLAILLNHWLRLSKQGTLPLNHWLPWRWLVLHTLLLIDGLPLLIHRLLLLIDGLLLIDRLTIVLLICLVLALKHLLLKLHPLLLKLLSFSSQLVSLGDLTNRLNALANQLGGLLISCNSRLSLLLRRDLLLPLEVGLQISKATVRHASIWIVCARVWIEVNGFVIPCGFLNGIRLKIRVVLRRTEWTDLSG